MPHWALKPLINAPSRVGDYIADEIDPIDNREDRGYVRPFIAGSLQGAGDVLSDMTSPVSIASSILGLGGFKRLSGLRKFKRFERPGMPSEAYERMGAEFVPRGEEEAFNAIRKTRAATENMNVSRMAEEGSRLTGKRLPISGDVDVTKIMRRIQAAKDAMRASEGR